ncbi:UNVERIFIED_CONTAM: hypothetical protein FKN15_055969 [Acipenser sinensis]
MQNLCGTRGNANVHLVLSVDVDKQHSLELKQHSSTAKSLAAELETEIENGGCHCWWVLKERIKEFLEENEFPGTPHEVQDAPYSLEIAGLNPGYSTAERGREFLGGGVQLAERHPGGEGFGRPGCPRLTTNQRPLETGRAPVGLPVSCLDLMPKTLEGQITMEKTPSYFVTREAPARISAMSRDTKLIVVVRDPVTRAISDYTQTLSKKPDIPTFESLTFKNRTTGLIDTSWSAIQIGIYAKHLENWLQYFPMSQILFVSGERLISDPAGELGRVQDFLGLKRIITDKHFYFNQTKGFPCLKKAEGSSKPHCLGKTKGRTHPNINPEVVQRLRDFYRPFNMKFYQMTGHLFGWDD